MYSWCVHLWSGESWCTYMLLCCCSGCGFYPWYAVALYIAGSFLCQGILGVVTVLFMTLHQQMSWSTRQDYPASKVHASYYIVICGLYDPTMFYSVSHKRHDFRRRRLWNVKPVFWVSLNVLSETFLLSRTQRDTVISDTGLHVQYPLLLPDFNETRIFWTDFRKVLKYQNS
jgi:hypothetical protein